MLSFTVGTAFGLKPTALCVLVLRLVGQLLLYPWAVSAWLGLLTNADAVALFREQGVQLARIFLDARSVGRRIAAHLFDRVVLRRRRGRAQRFIAAEFLRRRRRFIFVRERRHEAIAAARHIDDEGLALRAVAEGLAQGRDLDGEVVLLDEQPAPDMFHDLVLGD